MTNRNTLGRSPKQYIPYYDINSDFNTNSPSYYDYLARLNYTIQLLIDRLNEFDYAKLELEDTHSINLVKEIISSEDLDIDRLVKVTSNLKLADITKEVEFMDQVYKLKNAIEIGKSGVYAPDYFDILKDILTKLNEIISQITELDKRLTLIEILYKDLDDRITKLEENGGGTPTEDYLGNYDIKDFKPITGNNGVKEIVAETYAGGFQNEKTMVFDLDTGKIIGRLPSGHYGGSTDYMRYRYNVSEIEKLAKKNFTFNIINSDENTLYFDFMQTPVKQIPYNPDTELQYKKENNKDLFVPPKGIGYYKMTIYSDEEGRIERTYLKQILKEDKK